jgi:UDP-glucose 4-epimerase
MTGQTVLLTGGAGFIGSHTAVTLLEQDYEVVVVDNHSNSHPSVYERIEKLAGRPLAGVHRLDIQDRAGMAEVFHQHRTDAVIHFAGKKSVSESVALPLEYFDTNVAGTLSLLIAMCDAGVGHLVFSSSCSIYGDGGGRSGAFDETRAPGPTNPYARTKLICEQMIADACARYPNLRALSLRYFNPAGAHPSGLLGEDPVGPPSNVLPYIAQVAVGRRAELSVFGGDYATADGTCIRDYIHVVDVARAHVLALSKLVSTDEPKVMNLGTGEGTSVLDLVKAFEAASGRHIPYRIVERRPGDVARLVADPSAAAREWGWRPEYGLTDICNTAWEFQSRNPDGYEK